MRAPVDVSGWTRIHPEKKHPFWWGIFGVIAIELLVVLSFVASFFYLWIVNLAEGRRDWSPREGDLPPLLYPTINVGLLLVCAWSMWYGGVVMKKGRNIAFAWLVVLCCLCSFAVLWLRWLQFQEFNFDWKETAYGSLVWVMTGFHFMHVTAAVLGTAVIGWLSYKGYYNEKRWLGVQVDTMYWYFVVGGWLPMYLAIYWFPRWV